MLKALSTCRLEAARRLGSLRSTQKCGEEEGRNAQAEQDTSPWRHDFPRPTQHPWVNVALNRLPNGTETQWFRMALALGPNSGE
uniref:Uncharacterized protein n=1 Tax=Anguilla anguilla TaxID=7936 RepID=A0A0E9XEA1_ANGAN